MVRGTEYFIKALQFETKNRVFGAFLEKLWKKEWKYIKNDWQSKASFLVISVYDHFNDFDISSRVFELLTLALAQTKRQVIV